MLTETIQDRLKWFQDGCFVEVEGQVSVGEKKKDGTWEEEVVCTLSRYAIAFSVEMRVLLSLKNRRPKEHHKKDESIQCADAIIFEQLESGAWQLHIIECKKTIGESKWIDILDQFEGALLNAYALSGILGIQQLTQVKFYAAYRKDRLTDKLDTNPALLRPTGETRKQNRNIEWWKNRVNVFSLRDAELIKIQLDEQTGRGEVRLA